MNNYLQKLFLLEKKISEAEDDEKKGKKNKKNKNKTYLNRYKKKILFHNLKPMKKVENHYEKYFVVVSETGKKFVAKDRFGQKSNKLLKKIKAKKNRKEAKKISAFLEEDFLASLEQS